MPCPQCTTPREGSNTACYSCGWETLRPEDPLLGQVIADRYKLLRQIGSGSCGVVYAAEHLALQSKIAVKILHVSLARDPIVAERFRREALAMSKLTHPHALKLFDRGQTPEGTLWFAMELLEGEPLSARLARGELFSEKELVRLFESICEVLEEAHQQGIVHRDIKPANLVLVKGPGGALLAKLLDFGISDLKGAGDLTHPKLVSGTPMYMAPEQWKGLSFADARSDVYSLGVVAYQCLSGKLPLDADSPLAWLKKHQSEEPLDLRVALSRSVSEGVAQIIMSALSKDPDARPQSALAFYQSLKDGLPHKVNPRLSRKSTLASPKREPDPVKTPAPFPAVPPLIESHPKEAIPKIQEAAHLARKRPSLLRFGFAGAVGFLLLCLVLVPLLLGSSSRSVAEPLSHKQSVAAVSPESTPTSLRSVSSSAPSLSPAPTSAPLAAQSASSPATVPPKEPASAPALPKKQAANPQISSEELLTNKQGTINPWSTEEPKPEKTKQPASLSGSQETIDPWLIP